MCATNTCVKVGLLAMPPSVCGFVNVKGYFKFSTNAVAGATPDDGGDGGWGREVL